MNKSNTRLSALFGVLGRMPNRDHVTAIRRPAAGLSLVTLAILGLAPAGAHASLPIGAGTMLTSIAAAPNGGFWTQVDNRYDESYQGGTFARHGAPRYEEIFLRGSIASIPGRNGYWVVTHNGGIIARGDAPGLCGSQLSTCSSYPMRPLADQFIVAAAATPSGNGLWAVDRQGKVYPAGDANFYGDVRTAPQAVTGFAATPSGKGYYLVTETGQVFNFGDAVHYGSTGGQKPGGQSVTGIALSLGDHGITNGYWLTAEDGAIYTYGQAPFWGNAGINPTKVTGIVSFPMPAAGQPGQRTRGYALVHNNGTVGVHNRP
jgi:hypothetical protein